MTDFDALLARLGPDARFVARGPAVGHHGMARLFWTSGPITGTDVATVRHGRIVTLHVFLDPSPRGPRAAPR